MAPARTKGKGKGKGKGKKKGSAAAGALRKQVEAYLNSMESAFDSALTGLWPLPS